jgi:hypothetical protein
MSSRLVRPEQAAPWRLGMAYLVSSLEQAMVDHCFRLLEQHVLVVVTLVQVPGCESTTGLVQIVTTHPESTYC